MQSPTAQKPVSDKKNDNDLTVARMKNNRADNSLGAGAGMPGFLQRQPIEEEEMQPSLQRQPLEEEEIQPTSIGPVQRQSNETEEEELQAKFDSAGIQRQPVGEDEEMMQPASIDSLQRQPAEEDEEALQAKPITERLQRQPLEEEETEIQTKLSVGAANDEYEQEADAVADKVMRMASPQVATSHSQPTLQRQSIEEEDELQAKVDEGVQRQPTEEEEMAQPKLRRDTQASGGSTPSISSGADSQIQQMCGNGASLPSQVSNDMGSKMGADFSGVNVHTGADASDLNQQVNARAFTLGNDIFFNDGEYAPSSDSGQRLLAHELTHVVQQGGNNSNTLSRTDTEVPNEAGTTATGLVNRANRTITYDSIEIPTFKTLAHRGDLYNLWSLKRDKGYGSRPNNQRDVWKENLDTTGMVGVLRSKVSPDVPPINGQYAFRVRNRKQYYVGTLEEIATASSIPNWSHNERKTNLHVDHIVEMQISGYPGGQDANVIRNMELLEGRKNTSSGGTILQSVARRARATFANADTRPLLEATIPGLARVDGRTRPHTIKRNFHMIFNSYVPRQGSATVGRNHYWEKREVERGDHLEHLQESGLEGLAGNGQVMVFNSPNGGTGKLFSWDGSTTAPANNREKNWLWPWRIVGKQFQTNPDQINNSELGSLSLELPASSANEAAEAESISVSRFQNQRNVGGLELESSFLRRFGRELRATHFSPIELDSVNVDDSGLTVIGRVVPDIPFLQNVHLDLLIRDGEIQISKTFGMTDINVPSPFSVDNSSLSVFLSSTRGLGIEGDVDFGIERVGNGRIGAAASTEGGFALDGQFNFDERIFGEGTTAQVRMGYRDDQWSMGGTLTIPEGKVPGVRTATINVDYSEANGFSAQGDAELDVPGVESGTLAITHSEAEGFVIGGSFNLSADTPGIRGGTISAQVRERPDGSGYAVSASGEAQPDIPGINSNLTVSYDDGAFTAEVSADYSRGMLSGEINAGVTNRTVGEDGQLAETAEPDNPLIVYGGGSLTIQIAPWLQGSAGVEFAPDGEITVTGEIGLPDELEIFARREINRSIFNIAVQAPIFPGIVAEIGGGLGATAGIGPGVIDELSLGITYNPAHEEDTTITGDAHLNIPADAGLRLSVRAGIGLGITGASATGGLEIGGTLGIDGAAEAGVHIEWSPSAGLELEASVGVHAQPAFTFDISGYVSVRALGLSVYDETWELASFRFGSDYTFGIRLPIHYIEGQPFDISTDDIEFDVPDIDTDQLLRGLISRIA